MDNLQYYKKVTENLPERAKSFKPYYKWIIFNITIKLDFKNLDKKEVLNLIING